MIDAALRIEVVLAPHGLNHLLNNCNVARSSFLVLLTLFEDIQDGQPLIVVGRFTSDDEQRPGILAGFHVGQQQTPLSHQPSMTNFHHWRAVIRPIDIYQASEPMEIGDHLVPVRRYRR